MADQARLQAAFEQFDAVNREDPNKEMVNGQEYPKELLYALRMTECQEAFAPSAPEALRLAARSQHLARWSSPRQSYPMDRVGYLQWRTDLKKFHAAKAGEILQGVGYDAATIARVQTLLRKEGIKSDPDVQALEDIICLVFLRFYFADFAKQHEEEKIINIVRKTWGKMSDAGHEAALQLNFSAEELALITKALAP